MSSNVVGTVLLLISIYLITASNNFNTYVVNLENDYSNYITIKQNLAAVGYDQVFRFDAIDGYAYIRNKNHSLDHQITYFCRKFCPYAVIGCGLSHLLLSEHIYNSDVNNYALILEDDILPIYANIDVNFSNTIRQIVNHAPSDWDIIKLYCNFQCKYNVSNPTYELGYYYGSNAAYLVNKKAVQKELGFGQNMLFWHFDDQRWIYSRFHKNHLNIYKAPQQLFIADNTHSYTQKRDGNFLEWLADFYMNLFGEAQNVNDYKPSNIKVWRVFGYELSIDDCMSIFSAFFICIYVVIYKKMCDLSWMYTAILTLISYFGICGTLYVIFVYDPYVVVANLIVPVVITAIYMTWEKKKQLFNKKEV